MVIPAVGNLIKDPAGDVIHRQEYPVGNSDYGQLVQIGRALEAIPTKESIHTISGRTEQVSVGTSVTRIASANPYRKSIKITNVTGTQLIWLGFDNGVTASTGDYLHSAAGSNTTLAVAGEIWGIAATSAQTVSIMEEEYDH